jgi:hypothetical protein
VESIEMARRTVQVEEMLPLLKRHEIPRRPRSDGGHRANKRRRTSGTDRASGRARRGSHC